MFSKFAAIAGNTFTETIRQPIYGVLLWVAAGLLIVNPSISTYSLEKGSDIKIMKDVGLSTLLLYGLLASVFSAVGVITREIESHTVLTVVSKPVSRPLFLFGKFAGVSVAVLLGYYFLSVVFFLTVRHGVLETVADEYDKPVLVFGLLSLLISLIAAIWGNYVYEWHFSTTLTAWIVPLATLALGLVLFFKKGWELQSPLDEPAFSDLQIVFAVIMIFGAVLILTSFAVSFATRFGQVMTLILCAGVFLLGLLSDHYFGRNIGAGVEYQLLYAAIPNFQFFWVGDALTQNLPIPMSQVALVTGYAVLYAGAVLGLGIALFQTREVS